uniref:Uncharacterized protein MANES_16G106300 n=1 Tax=Rhizophora mucronata TaxID=61149 RepID=A0A2P2JRD7_RHIMU
MVHKWEQQEYLKASEHPTPHKKISGGILHLKSLKTLKMRRAICYPFSLILHNTKPVGHQVVEMPALHLLDLISLSISLIL